MHNAHLLIEVVVITHYDVIIFIVETNPIWPAYIRLCKQTVAVYGEAIISYNKNVRQYNAIHGDISLCPTKSL